jgi:hypothetical protein
MAPICAMWRASASSGPTTVSRRIVRRDRRVRDGSGRGASRLNNGLNNQAALCAQSERICSMTNAGRSSGMKSPQPVSVCAATCSATVATISPTLAPSPFSPPSTTTGMRIFCTSSFSVCSMLTKAAR